MDDVIVKHDSRRYELVLTIPYLSGNPLRGLEREMVRLANGLRELGDSVRIVTTDQIPPGKTDILRPAELDVGIPIERHPGYLPTTLRGLQASGASLAIPKLKAALSRCDACVVFNAGWPVPLLLAHLGRRTSPTLYRTYWHPPRGRSAALNRIRRGAAAAIFSRCQRLLAPTHVEAEVLQSLTSGAVDIAVVEPGADQPSGDLRKLRRRVRDNLGLDDGALLLTQVGSPNLFKGTDIAVRIVEILRDSGKDARLLIIGDEPISTKMAVLEQRIPKWLIYAGALNDKEKSAHLAGSDAVLVLSQYEAFGFVALEAIVHEVTPVLWSDLPAAAVLVGKGAVTVPRTGGATSAARAVLQAVNSRPEAALVRSWSEYVQDVRLQIESVLVRG